MKNLEHAGLVVINNCDMLCKQNSNCEKVQEKIQQYLVKKMKLDKKEKINNCLLQVFVKKK